MLMSRLSSLAHKLLMLMFILMLASQVKTGLNSKTLFKPEEFENADFSLRLGLPSTLIHHENEAFRKRSSNQRKLRTPTFRARFLVDRKRIFLKTMTSRLSCDLLTRVFLVIHNKKKLNFSFVATLRAESLWSYSQLIRTRSKALSRVKQTMLSSSGKKKNMLNKVTRSLQGIGAMQFM